MIKESDGLEPFEDEQGCLASLDRDLCRVPDKDEGKPAGNRVMGVHPC